jgi:2-methylcitrate dehydratase PrpD
MAESGSDVSAHTKTLAEFIARSPDRALPPDVVAKTKSHILDTIAAIVSGSRLRAGRLAAEYVQSIGGNPEALVVGTPLILPAISAAMANGMAAHADETDDSHLAGKFHPGCAIVPAALAIGERQERSGTDLIRAVALGYDIGARVTFALGVSRPDTARHSTHSLAPAFGAAAAAAALLRLDAHQVRHVLSYSSQQASGIPFWQRDPEHVEKAFDFGGMTARNAVTGATMVAAGFSAVEDPLSGKHNLFTAFGEDPDPARVVDGLGERFEIMRASIKKWCVGSPNQAVLDAITALINAHGIKAGQVKRVTITMPDDRVHIVDNGSMPDVCVQHLAALALVDGTVTFASCHDHERMDDPAIRKIRKLVELIPSAELTAAVPARQAIVEIETAGGEKHRHHAKSVRGTPENPMDEAEVNEKAGDLIRPVLGDQRSDKLIVAVRELERVASLRELRQWLKP